MIDQNQITEYLDSVIIKSRTLIDNLTVENDSQIVVAYHYKRALNLLRSIRSLSVYGSAIEISVLLRSLFNLRINLGWLLHDEINERVSRYLDFAPIYRKEYFDYFIENGQDSSDNFSKEEYEEAKTQFDATIDKYNLNPRNYRDLNNWSGISIYRMAEQINAEDEYTALYSKASHIEHTNPNVSHLYLNLDEENKIKTSVQDLSLIISFIHLGIHYFLVVKHLTSTSFDSLDSDSILSEIVHFKKHQAAIYEQIEKMQNT